MDKRAIYKKSILKELFFDKELSAADLCSLTGKSLPLITRLLTELIEDGSIVENGYALSTGGRRPQIFSMQPDLMYVISVAVDQYITSMALIDMHGKIVGDVLHIELALPNNIDSLDIVRSTLLQFIKQIDIAKRKIVGIGIGMPGFVDVNKGINHSFLHSKQGSIVSYIKDSVDIPVFIDNDSSLIALAELRMGLARNMTNSMVINLSWGVGLGMILEGRLFRGNDGFAGEFSHMPLFSNYKMCACGKSGCLETETSLYVVVEKAIRGLEEGKASFLENISLQHIDESANAIMLAAKQGDKFAVELISEAGYNIGRGVSILIHLLNPAQIILSGRGSIAGKLWLTPLQQALNEHCIPRLAASTNVEISTLGPNAQLLGAAALVMENFPKSHTHLSAFDKQQSAIEEVLN
jgi:predicted NBD/HSP70 family sugar kinase